MKKQNLVDSPKEMFGEREDYAERILSKELGNDYVNYRKKWIKACNRKVVTDFPLYIQIEHVGRCNLHCATCIQGIKELRDKYSQGFKPLDMELYKKIITEAKKYKCPSIAFHNNDEPLILQDLEVRIKMAKEAGFLDLIMTTNANLLTQERADKLLLSGLTKINFSVDTFNEADYEKIRLGGNFKTVLKNIEYFSQSKKKLNLKLPVTRATCVLTKFTIKKMDQFRDFWSKRVDMVEFQNFLALKGYTEKMRPPKAKIFKDFTCNSPWQQIVIRANGDVLPCCSFYSATMVVGNVKHSSIHEIWHSQKMREIRNELLKNNFNFFPNCKICSETFYTL